VTIILLRSRFRQAGGSNLELELGLEIRPFCIPKFPRHPEYTGVTPDAWITVGISSKRSKGNQTLKNLLTFFAKVDSEEATTVSDQPSLATKEKKTVLLKHKARTTSHGEMALIDDERFVAVFELRRFDEQQFNEALPKFKQIVESYRSVAANKKPAK
jgi:tRNA/tmRNA/rRNA uracil-C5-methylase (TrmA/RlmC/RlmD family)